jgi:hypothetical protein
MVVIITANRVSRVSRARAILLSKDMAVLHRKAIIPQR